jgi:hypothetical protein
MRIGMFLEIATTIGAIAGALIATHVSTATIAVVFGVVLLYSAYLSIRTQAPRPVEEKQDAIARALHLDGDYPTTQGRQHYTVHRIPLGFGLMLGAGTLSGLLGIGSGAVKVLAMDQAMRIPFKVSTTTSNFMIGVTAAASAGVYLARGYIDPGIAMPVVLGALAGSMLGAKVLVNARTKILRVVFSAVIVALGLEMIFNGFTGRL